MICYKDITFCDFAKCYKFGEKCSRSLTDKVKEGAKRWMGEDAPICVFVDQPECFVSKEAHERAEQSMKLKDVNESDIGI